MLGKSMWERQKRVVLLYSLVVGLVSREIGDVLKSGERESERQS